MILPAVGLIAGIVLGLILQVPVPALMARYLGIALLAALDSSIGGLRAALGKEFNEKLFMGGFVVNTSIAALIVYIGDNLGIEIYLAAVVAFGVRIFQNLALIRRHFFKAHHWE
jgi:small basic protein